MQMGEKMDASDSASSTFNAQDIKNIKDWKPRSGTEIEYKSLKDKFCKKKVQKVAMKSINPKPNFKPELSLVKEGSKVYDENAYTVLEKQDLDRLAKTVEVDEPNTGPSIILTEGDGNILMQQNSDLKATSQLEITYSTRKGKSTSLYDGSPRSPRPLKGILKHSNSSVCSQKSGECNIFSRISKAFSSSSQELKEKHGSLPVDQKSRTVSASMPSSRKNSLPIDSNLSSFLPSSPFLLPPEAHSNTSIDKTSSAQLSDKKPLSRSVSISNTAMYISNDGYQELSDLKYKHPELHCEIEVADNGELLNESKSRKKYKPKSSKDAEFERMFVLQIASSIENAILNSRENSDEDAGMRELRDENGRKSSATPQEIQAVLKAISGHIELQKRVKSSRGSKSNSNSGSLAGSRIVSGSNSKENLTLKENTSATGSTIQIKSDSPANLPSNEHIIKPSHDLETETNLQPSDIPKSEAKRGFFHRLFK